MRQEHERRANRRITEYKVRSRSRVEMNRDTTFLRLAKAAICQVLETRIISYSQTVRTSQAARRLGNVAQSRIPAKRATARVTSP